MAILKEKVGLSNADLRKLRSMRPGMLLDLQVSAPLGIKRVRTEFVGMDGIRCLILKFPDESKWGSLREAIYPENSLVVRYLLEGEAGEVIAFKVKVTLVLSKPGNYIFTTFPLSIQSQGLRSEQRAQTRVPVDVFEVDKKGKSLPGVILDLSSSGCKVGIARSLQKMKFASKQGIRLRLRSSEGRQGDLLGTVMNARSDELNHYFGVKFDASEEVVEGLLAQLMLD